MSHRLIRDVIESRSTHVTSPGATIVEAARLMKKHAIGALLVVDDGELVGIFTERDALFRVTAADKSPKTTKVGAVMTRKPRTITADRPLGHALHLMYEGGFRHVPVVDKGRPVGMVSARDALGPELAEFESDLDNREHIKEIL